ncbi:DnaJ-domain-containing protein, partial [Ramicandelaber brevisporus]
IETEYYALLQVEPSASEAELKKAYRKLAMQCHPDRNPAPEMADRFKDISNAYRVLSVARTREVYDRFGKAGINNLAALGEHLTADQLLEAMYGPSGQHPHHGRGASNGSIKRSSGSITSILIVALADLYNGCSKEVNIVRYTGCTDCNGSGRIFSSADVKKKPCADCMGSGYISRLAHHHSQPQSRQQQMVKTQCTACNGYGSVSISSTCRKCSASGILPERRKLAVHVEKGMKSGNKITLRGEGDCTPDTVANGNGAGDAILVLRQKIESNAKFIRHGNDLYTTATISLAEAMFGFDRVLLTHMDGRGIRVKRMQQPQQQQKTLQPGEVLVIKGEGMPQYRRPFDKGDLYIRVNVELPSAEWL